MNINQFEKPTFHPIGMCQGYNDGYGKENYLTAMLIKHIEKGDWEPVKMKFDYPSLATKHGLISGSFEDGYALTNKAKGLLFGHFGKEQAQEDQELYEKLMKLDMDQLQEIAKKYMSD